jgi:hypothetical protein
MFKNTGTVSKRRWPAVAAGAVFTAALAFGCFSGSASAEDRGRDHRDYHHRDWNGGYYRAPPVVYGSPYYYAPPVIWGPGLNINIR